jgi:hypothetical protein
MANDTDRDLLRQVNREFMARGLSPLTAEQLECLGDPTRADEALDMIDDWEARLGMSAHLRAELAARIVDSYYIHHRG